MEFATTDPSATPWGIESPLDSIETLLLRLGADIDERRLAIRLADRWLQEDRETGVALAVLAHAMRPETSGISQKPGAADVVTIGAGVLPKPQIEALASLWDPVLDIIEREQPSGLGGVFSMVTPWVFPGTLAMGRGPSPDVLSVMHTAAKPVIQRLANTYADSWVAMHRLRPLAQECGVEVRVQEPFATMFPVERWTGSGDYNEWEQEVIGAVRSLAKDLSEQPVSAVAKLIATAERDASEASINWPRSPPTSSSSSPLLRAIRTPFCWHWRTATLRQTY